MNIVKPRWFRDQRNPEMLIPEAQIKREYGQHVTDGSIDPSEKTFSQYLNDCMESEGGTLSEAVPESAEMGTYRFLIRETLTMHVTVEAKDFEAAQEEVWRQYEYGEYDLDRNCFAGAEIRPCCSECSSDFDEDAYELREVDDGTANPKLLCDRCVADMENDGTLTRCDCCGEVFTPSRLIKNPENGEQELCPLCGEIWCD